MVITHSPRSEQKDWRTVCRVVLVRTSIGNSSKANTERVVHPLSTAYRGYLDTEYKIQPGRYCIAHTSRTRWQDTGSPGSSQRNRILPLAPSFAVTHLVPHLSLGSFRYRKYFQPASNLDRDFGAISTGSTRSYCLRRLVQVEPLETKGRDQTLLVSAPSLPRIDKASELDNECKQTQLK
jgi:hypothetical protein